MKNLVNLIIQPISGADILDLSVLMNTLTQISGRFSINSMELSGDNVINLSDFYLDFLFKLCFTYVKKVSIVTDVAKISEAISNDQNIRYIYKLYPRRLGTKEYELYSLLRAISSNKNIEVQIPDIECTDPIQIIKKLNDFQARSLEIIPTYPTNATLAKYFSFTFFEKTVQSFLPYLSEMQFAFLNKLQIDGIQNLRNSNVSTLVVNAAGNFGVPTYDQNIYTIKQFTSLDEVEIFFKQQDALVDSYCHNCPKRLKCLAKVINTNWEGESCSGYKNLLDF